MSTGTTNITTWGAFAGWGKGGPNDPFGSNSSGIFGTGSGLGQAVGSIGQGIGSLAEASSYSEAAKIASQNAGIARNSGQVQEAQLTRSIETTVGSQEAEVAGAGLKQTGVAGNLYRSSMQQANLSKQLVNLQTDINVNAFEQEATQYKGMASSATATGLGGIFGGILGIFGL